MMTERFHYFFFIYKYSNRAVSFRTLKYLMEHLNKIAQHSGRTGMTDRNLAIVWAPNLLRSPSLEAGGVAALRGVGVQAVVTGKFTTINSHETHLMRFIFF